MMAPKAIPRRTAAIRTPKTVSDMPGISGRELSERVKAVRPDIRVLYMSGYTDQAVVHHGILQSDAVLLQKPFTLSALALKLREILGCETLK